MSASLTPNSANEYLFTVPNNPDLITGLGCGTTGNYPIRSEDIAFLYEAQEEFRYLSRESIDIHRQGVDERRWIKPVIDSISTSRTATVNLPCTTTDHPMFFDARAIFGSSLEYSSNTSMNDVVIPTPLFGLNNNDGYHIMDVYYNQAKQMLDDTRIPLMNIVKYIYGGINRLHELWISKSSSTSTFVSGTHRRKDDVTEAFFNSHINEYEYTHSTPDNTESYIPSGDLIYKYYGRYTKRLKGILYWDNENDREEWKTSNICNEKREDIYNITNKYRFYLPTKESVDQIGGIGRYLSQFKAFAIVTNHSYKTVIVKQQYSSETTTTEHNYIKRIVDITDKCNVISDSERYYIEANISSNDVKGYISKAYDDFDTPADPSLNRPQEGWYGNQNAYNENDLYSEVRLNPMYAVIKPLFRTSFT